MPATVTLKTKKLGALAGSMTGPAMGSLHKKIGAIYRSFAQERFNTFARGGGDWKPLAEATKKRRRKATTFSILIDTGLLFAALNPTLSAGAIQETKGTAVRLGFGGPARYPDGKATLADIASFHHFGQGVPKRPIIVEPDKTTLDLMTRRVNEWLETRLQ